MKVAVVFVQVGHSKPEYQHGEKRLVDSWVKHSSGHPYELVVINRYTDPGPTDDIFPGQVMKLRYDGGGWDCGAWQFAGRNIDTDLLVCFNSSTYVTGDGWLRRFVEAVEKHGDGLYGPLTSYEIIPHVRTPCMIFQPHVIKDYPVEVNSREDTYRFESFGFSRDVPNFTQWVARKNLATMLVTWDGEYDLPNWRKPDNIFRRGDQSNLIVKDRHCEAYEVSQPEGRRVLEALADGR